MKIEYNDPGRCFGKNDKAVDKVIAALTKISGARSILSGSRVVKDTAMQIEVGPDEWQTHIRIVDKKGRAIGYYFNGQYIGTITKKLEIIYLQ